MPTRARRSKLPVIPHREGITLPPGRSAGGGLDQRGGYRIAAVTVAYGPQRLSGHAGHRVQEIPPIRWRGKSPSPHAAWCRRRSAGTPRALSTRRSRFTARAAPGTGRSNSVARAGQSRPGAVGTSHGNAVKLAEIRLFHIGAGYRGQSGLGQRNGSRQRQRSRRERRCPGTSSCLLQQACRRGGSQGTGAAQTCQWPAPDRA